MTGSLLVRVENQEEGERRLHLMKGVWVGVVDESYNTGRGIPMIIVGFAGSVSQGTSRGSGTRLTPPSFTLTLT